MVVCGGGVCTAQRPVNSATGGEIPDTVTSVDGDPPSGIYEFPDQANKGSVGGGTVNHHCCAGPGGTGTTLHATETIPRKKVVDVADVAVRSSRNGTGRLHTRLGPARFP